MPLKSTMHRRDGRISTIRGGIQPITAGGSTRFLTFPALGSLTGGTDTTPVASRFYFCSLFIPHNVILTGIGYLIGSVGGTDKAIVSLFDADGKQLAFSAVAGVTVGTTATFQEIPFTAPVQVTGPGWYYVAVVMNGTTARLRTIPTALGISQTALTKQSTGTFGLTGDFTPPTTFTADAGPIAYTY